MKHSAETKAAARAAYEAGESLSAIKERLGVSDTTILKWTCDVPRRLPRLTTATKDSIRANYADGLSIDTIAQEHGVSRSSVFRLTKDLPARYKRKEEAPDVAPRAD